MDTKKFLKKVILNADVYSVCLQHALSTEKEEVMGLLIGYVDEEESTSYVLACTILTRLDKQSDRVEIHPEQLLTASSYAERLSLRVHKELRVIGWYHSHPHITVWPSHVDVRTQNLYQMLDPFYIGLIFSVFPRNAGSTDNQVQVTAFQSQKNGDSDVQRLEIKLEINDSHLETYNLEALTTLPKILVEEEKENHNQLNDHEDLLVNLHNRASETIKHTHIAHLITRPMCEDHERRLIDLKVRAKELKKIKAQLLKE